jgi:hypothetical protein
MNTATAVASIKGAIKSVTIWVAAFAEVFGEFAPYVTPGLLTSLGLDAHTTTVICRYVAGAMILCRTVTTKSLADKVTPPAPPAA